MEKIKRFFKTAGIYFVGNVLTKLVSFLLLPIYTNRIDPVSYGEYGLTITVLNVLVPIVFFCIWDSVFRFAFDHSDEDEKYQVLNNGFVVMLAGSAIFLIATGIIYVCTGFASIGLICMYSLAMGFQYFYTAIARALKDNNLFVFSGCVNTFISILLNLCLILVFEMGVEALYISYIVGVIFQIAIIEQKKKFIKHISIKNFRKSVVVGYLKFSIPVTVSAISNWLLNGLTQVFITYSLGSYYNGLYNVANKFSSVLILVIGVFQFAWSEMAYDLAGDENKTRYYKKSISEILRLSIICVSIVILVVKMIYPIMIDEQYSESLVIIPVLLIGTMANSYAGFLGTLFLADKKSFSLFTTTLFAGIVNLIGLNVLTHIFGFFGAVLSLCLSFVLYVFIRVLMLKKKLNVVPYGYSIIPLIVLTISIVAFYTIDSLLGLLFVVITVVLLSLFMVRTLLMQGIRVLCKRGTNED